MILNLTQHTGTPEQGVTAPTRVFEIRELLTFESQPTLAEITDRAETIAMLAADQGAKCAMIGGAPYLMRPLENALIARDIVPCYSFSTRVSIETLVDGVLTKTSVFKHAGFIMVE